MNPMPGRAAFLLLTLLAATASLADEPEVSMLRLSDEGSLTVSVVRAARGQGPATTAVVVLMGPRGNRIFLGRSQPEPGVVRNEAWLGRNASVAFTRREGEPVLLDAGGHSVRFYEADLGRPTVCCWLHALVCRVDPAILEAAAGISLLRSWTGSSELGDDFYPVRVLSQVAEPLAVQPRGAITVRRGPFAGEPWERLAREAVEELGRP
jgi:hypothetical protein